MDADFWLQRWQTNQIAFHDSQVNPMLTRHVDKLPASPGERIFVPLCGKTRDIAWLLAKGYQVVGVELVPLAVEQLFAEMEVVPRVSQEGALLRHSAKGLDILQGDIFDVSSSILGPVARIYDRAALVALPEAMRRHYAAHMIDITGCAPQLLICYEYDQSRANGPPFSVNAEEIHQHYGVSYNLSLLETAAVSGGIRGETMATVNAWLLE